VPSEVVHIHDSPCGPATDTIVNGRASAAGFASSGVGICASAAEANTPATTISPSARITVLVCMARTLYDRRGVAGNKRGASAPRRDARWHEGVTGAPSFNSSRLRTAGADEENPKWRREDRWHA
jgi:hypothetical protein